jgi:hypothetical protein
VVRPIVFERGVCISAQRVEHPVAVIAVRDDERAFDHRGHEFQRVGTKTLTSNRRCRVEGEPPGEGAQASKEDPLIVVEQVDAPLDGRAKRLLPTLASRPDSAEQREPVVEALEDRVR